MSGLTLGVEEEFLLVDPTSGHFAPAAPAVLQLLADEPSVTPEFMRYQIEVATKVCDGLGQVRSELCRLRGLLARAAERVGCRLVAAGALPLGPRPEPSVVSEYPRYRELAQRFTAFVANGGTCGCHVHIGVPSREIGVQVLSRLRLWLPQLLAIGANSPVVFGRDTGWASWRYWMWSRWPTVRTPQIWTDPAHYDASVREQVVRGAAIDPRSVHFHARLSPQYPTVEVRIADVCLSVDTTVLLAGLVRAAVATAIEEFRDGRPVAAVRTEMIEAALAVAARHGVDGPGIDVLAGDVVPQRILVDRLLEHLRPGLLVTGDGDEVHRLAATVLAGAGRQRTLRAGTATAGDFVAALADVTAGTRSPIG